MNPTNWRLVGVNRERKPVDRWLRNEFSTKHQSARLLFFGFPGGLVCLRLLGMSGPVVEMLVEVPMFVAKPCATGGSGLAVSRAQVGLAGALGADRARRNQLL